MHAPSIAYSKWQARPEFSRFLADLMRAELSRLRPDLKTLSHHWSAETSFASGPLELDSLDRLKLASAVATALHFSSAGIADHLREAAAFGDWVAEARRVSERTDGALAFKSSGSSGAATLVLHDPMALDREISALAALFAPRTRIVALVPAHHLYGFLFTVLLPDMLGCTVVDARGLSPASLGALTKPGDLLVAFPTAWAAAVEAGVRWPEDVLGVTSGAALKPELFPALRGSGLRGLYEVYGSTETGGIGWRNDGAAPFRLFGYWTKLDDARLLKAGVEYLLPDVVTWLDVEHLIPGPRRDHAVQVGGVNVYPSRARSVLLAHAEVADAAVRLMRAHEGERLKAFIVPKDPSADRRQLLQALVEWVQWRLAVMERPRSFTFGPRIPANSAGKPTDWSIEAGDDE